MTHHKNKVGGGMMQSPKVRRGVVYRMEKSVKKAKTNGYKMQNRRKKHYKTASNAYPKAVKTSQKAKEASVKSY